MAEIWTELLGGEPVGAHDNFFERGGHSLMAIQLLARLRQTFEVEATLRDFPRGADRLAIGGHRRARTGGRQRCPGSAAHAGPARWSRCLRHSHRSGSGFSINWNRAVRPTTSRRPSRSWAASTLRLLVRPSARSFADTRCCGPHWSPRRGSRARSSPTSLELTLELEDLSGLPEGQRQAAAAARIREEAQRPFDLARGPLVRARLLRLGEQEHIALVIMHHAVSDGWSIGILIREVSALYESFAERRVVSASRAADPVRRLRRLATRTGCRARSSSPARLLDETARGHCPISNCPRTDPGRLVASQRGGERSTTLPKATLEARASTRPTARARLCT